MYEKILVPVENTPYDDAIVDHVRQLAKVCNSAIVLIHVADGWAARNISQLDLQESEEMQKDRAYIEQVAAALEADGFNAEALLASGDPAAEISQAATREGCDLIAMSTHGHKFIGDMIHGSVSHSVRHSSLVPVLLVRGNAHGRNARKQ
ncbi:MAG: universal stress protein [Gemmatimonadaceae bacterium]|nr:universal stress protein [Gemmatimonadaceae bacterium]MDQ3244115.1 universal stress protein [Gemmatimonadota bacterium]